MQEKKDREIREKCNTKQAQKSSCKKRDIELDSIRKKQQKEDELTKDAFDIVMEASGLGLG